MLWLKPNSLYAALILFMGVTSHSSAAHATSGDQNERVIVHLLDYLAKDYGATVSNGKIANAEEYAEQIEFIRAVESTARGSPTFAAQDKKAKSLLKEFSRLKTLIEQKRPENEVATLARTLQRDTVEFLKIDQAPARLPNLKRGRTLYATQCASCHGSSGHGDGPAGLNLTPKPANFTDTERMRQLSAFQAFNTIRLGVQGTGMLPFAHFSDDDTWNVAFYILSIRHGELKESVILDESFDAGKRAQLSKLTDGELEKTLGKAELGRLRTTVFEPAQSTADEGFKTAKNLIEQSVTAYRQANAGLSKTLAIRAYLEGVEIREAQIKAHDSKARTEIEAAMSALRASIEAKAPADSVEREARTAIATLNRHEHYLMEKSLSNWVIGASSASIVLREGFEAVFIIIAILGALSAMRLKAAIRYVHAGWIAALLLGFAAWPLSNQLMQMSGASRELMEGVLSLIAVAVLLVVGFWLHQRTQAKRWQSFLKTQVQDAAHSSRWLSLALLSFFAVFREAIETVLFLRALTLNSGAEASQAMVIGITLALIATLVLAVLMLRYSKKLPIARLFSIAAAIMAATSVLLIGKAARAFQEAGLLGIQTVGKFNAIDFLGLYPSLQTLAAQGLMIAIIAALHLWTREPKAEILPQ